jgi:nicotinate-nucleotide adenylyltransferase
MRIGIYGGTFDPIHLAHLLLAEAAIEKLGLDEVRFVLAAQSPLKQNRPTADQHRIEMLQLAICGNAQFALDTRELKRPGVSYTVDTLREIVAEQPESKLFLMIGADSLNDFARWKYPAEICSLASLAIAERGGQPSPNFEVLQGIATDVQIAAFKQSTIPMPVMELSSSEIRSRAASKRTIRYQVPSSVEAYIHTHKLYQQP